jgi:hypothetical protein
MPNGDSSQLAGVGEAQGGLQLVAMAAGTEFKPSAS